MTRAGRQTAGMVRAWGASHRHDDLAQRVGGADAERRLAPARRSQSAGLGDASCKSSRGALLATGGTHTCITSSREGSAVCFGCTASTAMAVTSTGTVLRTVVVAGTRSASMRDAMVQRLVGCGGPAASRYRGCAGSNGFREVNHGFWSWRGQRWERRTSHWCNAGAVGR